MQFRNEQGHTTDGLIIRSHSYQKPTIYHSDICIGWKYGKEEEGGRQTKGIFWRTPHSVRWQLYQNSQYWELYQNSQYTLGGFLNSHNLGSKQLDILEKWGHELQIENCRYVSVAINQFLMSFPKCFMWQQKYPYEIGLLVNVSVSISTMTVSDIMM